METRYKRYFKEDKFEESVVPSKMDDTFTAHDLDSLQSLSDIIVELIWEKEGFTPSRKDIKFGESETTFNKMPLAGSSYFSIPFEDMSMGCYGSFNIYTPTGLLNSSSGIVRWVELNNPTNNAHRIIKIVLK